MTDTITTLEHLSSPKVTLSSNSLSLSPDATREEINGIFAALNTCESSSLWWIGDALAQTEKEYGDTYVKAMENCGYNLQTLKDARGLCRRISAEKRRKVSYSHHRNALYHVGVENVEQALFFLDIAEREKLSVSELRKEIRLALNPPAPTDGTRLIEDEDARERLEVLNAVETIKRFLLTTEPEAVAFIEKHLTPRLRELLSLSLGSSNHSIR